MNAVIKDFFYTDNTGGVNLRSNQARVNQTLQATEMRLISNMDLYEEGGFVTQKGNVQLNSGVTDDEAILGLDGYKINDTWYVIYTKASGKAYVMSLSGGPETEIKTGLNSAAKPKFIQFNSKAICFNGVDTPWAWNGTSVSNLTGLPASWSSIKPHDAAVYRGGRIFAIAGSTVYYCALGNENDWTSPGDAGSLSNLFTDDSTLTGVVDYGSALAIFSSRPRLYLLTGATPSTYSVDPKATNDSLTGRYAWAKDTENLYFFTGNWIKPLVTTDLGVIKLNAQLEITRRIAPFISGIKSILPMVPIDRTRLDEPILLSNQLKNELIGYFPQPGYTGFTIAAIFNMTTGGWCFRQATEITCAAVINGVVVTGTNDGKILQEFQGSSVVAGSFQKRILSPWFFFESPKSKKSILRMWLWFRAPASTTLTIRFFTDFNDNLALEERTITLSGDEGSAAYEIGEYDIDTYGGELIELKDFAPNLTARHFSFELLSDSDGTEYEFIAYGFEVEYLDAY